METLIKFFVALLFLSFVSKGSCSCSLENITIGTVRTGNEILGKPEWKVTVINNCVCAQSRIILRCPGFQTVKHVNPAILSKQGDDCVLVYGDTLPASGSVTFSYAWDPPFILLPKSSIIAGC